MDIPSNEPRAERSRPCLQRIALSTGLVVQAGGALIALGVLVLTFVR